MTNDSPGRRACFGEMDHANTEVHSSGPTIFAMLMTLLSALHRTLFGRWNGPGDQGLGGGIADAIDRSDDDQHINDPSRGRQSIAHHDRRTACLGAGRGIGKLSRHGGLSVWTTAYGSTANFIPEVTNHYTFTRPVGHRIAAVHHVSYRVTVSSSQGTSSSADSSFRTFLASSPPMPRPTF